MLGNFVIGVGILAPTGMLDRLAAGLGVGIGAAGLLVTYGAVVLCFGSPLMAWLTSRIDRRTLLCATLVIFALGHVASALAPGYGFLLAIRLVMLLVAAVYTPQAASTVALIVSEKERPGAIAFVFLGWSLAVAAGLPIVSYLAHAAGWRVTFAALGALAGLSFLLLAFTLPSGLAGTRVSLATWAAVARNRLILLLLAITALQTAGPFVIFTYLDPLVHALGGNPATVQAFFAAFGVAGFIGNVIATRLVIVVGAYRVSLAFQASVILGLLAWSLGAGTIAIMAIGIGLWGLGFAALNSMQQARLVGAGPQLAPASVALNTSSIYVGQGTGSALGGLLFTGGHVIAMGYAALAFLAVALAVTLTTRPGR
jgi:predicted MFS family arabinose efflux permease